MGNYTITLSAEEEKALLTDMISIQDWLNNAIHNKARQCIDAITKEVLSPHSVALTPSAKGQVMAKLGQLGIAPLIPLVELPREVKELIVSLAIIKSAAERQAELEEV